MSKQQHSTHDTAGNKYGELKPSDPIGDIFTEMGIKVVDCTPDPQNELLRELLVGKLKRAYFNGHTDNDARKSGVIRNDTKLGEHQIELLADEAMAAIKAHTDQVVREARKEPVGDAIEVDVDPDTMYFVMTKIKLKNKTVADRLLVQESLVEAWRDRRGDKYDLRVCIWRLRLLAHLTHRFNWAVFLLESKNIPGLHPQQPEKTEEG